MKIRVVLAILIVFSIFMFTACGGSESSDYSSLFGGSSGGGGSGGGGAGGDDSVSLSWQAPTTNEDNTPLVDLAGYRVYYGTSAAALDNQIDVTGYTTCSIGNLTPGVTYYFVVTAYDSSGNESGYSNIVSTTI